MVRSSKCPDTGLKRQQCYCPKCNIRHNNAVQRSGNLRRDRKGTNRKEHDTKGRNYHGRSSNGKRR